MSDVVRDEAADEEAREQAEIQWIGLDALRPFLVPIDDLAAHPDNPRRGNLAEVGKSLQRFGQMRPILVNSERVVLAGNHTLRAASEMLGWTHIAAVVVSEGEVESDEQIAYLLADNRTSDLATYEDAKLADLLKRYHDAGRLEGTGYSPDDYDDLMAALGKVGETEREPFGGGYAESPDEIAAREALRKAGATMREVVLMFDEGEYAEFGNFVKMLKREWGKGGVGETVFEAVKRQAQAVGLSDAPPEATE